MDILKILPYLTYSIHSPNPASLARLANVSESGESEQNRLANVSEPGESELNRLSNVGKSGKSGTFQKKAILASTEIRQKWRISYEYSNSLNSLASDHCLIIMQFLYFRTFDLRIEVLTTWSNFIETYYCNFQSHEKCQNNSISWSKLLSISCFDLIKFDLLTTCQINELYSYTTYLYSS